MLERVARGHPLSSRCLPPTHYVKFLRRRYLQDIHMSWPCNPPRLHNFLHLDFPIFPLDFPILLKSKWPPPTSVRAF